MIKLGFNYMVKWEIEKTSILKRAFQRFERDLHMVLNNTMKKQDKSIVIVINYFEGEVESYRIKVEDRKINIEGADELGIIYALLFISEKFMGIAPFWYWNDQKFIKTDYISIPRDEYVSGKYKIRFRGWFINDEVLLDAWGKELLNKESGITENYAWEMAMEALLRLGGNMVIPGTDYNSHKYRALAVDMGLWISHHHAEPLGAKMFARTYPHLTPSYKEHPELFHKLWQDAIEEQKGHKTIWNLGFRGQGDKPFWTDDPFYDTKEKRGALISELILKQYHEVAKRIENPVCCINLYGEVMELYQQGYIKLPENVIYIWADNGYGKMVSRRQGNHNPRVYALPKAKKGHHGIYYHASFYDLQAASHITMLPNSPEFVEEEIEGAMDKGVHDFIVINCSNVRPHTYMLDKIARIWGKDMAEFIDLYYTDYKEEIKNLYEEYFNVMIQYGPNEDDKAGEQFYHYLMRRLCYQWSLNKKDGAKDLLWLVGDISLRDQLAKIGEMVRLKIKKQEEFYNKSMSLIKKSKDKYLMDSLGLQASIHYKSSTALLNLLKAYDLYEDKKYEASFFALGETIEIIESILEDMKRTEHGKWNNFYENDCLTDVKFTIYSIESVMRFVRSLGDGPHYFKWALKYCYEEADHRVVLITNMRNHPRDRELYMAMKLKKEEKIL